MEEVIKSAGDDPMMKMQMIAPVVQDIQKDVLEKYGFPATGLMMAVMQIQMFAPQDPEIATGVALLMGKLNGSA